MAGSVGQLQMTLTSNPNPNTPSKVPQFLQKLYRIVSDSTTSDLICWSEDGLSFFILDHERLAKEQLGSWFKHQNIASFVRQLNMYGFRKVPHLQQGVLKSDTTSEVYQFSHDCFRRGQEHLLQGIERKKSQKEQSHQPTSIVFPALPAPALPEPPSGIDMNSVVTAVAAIRRHQNSISTELNDLRQSNRALWQETIDSREKNQKQQDTINRIVKFLAGVFGTQVSSTGSKENESPSNPSVVPVPISRLMIENKRDGQKAAAERSISFARDISPASDRFFSLDTPASTAEPPSPSPSMIDASALPPSNNPIICPSATEKPKETAAPPSPRYSPSMDAKIQSALGQLSASDLQQFIASLIAQPITDPSSSSNGSQMAQFQSPFDFGALSSPTLSLPSPPPPLNTDDLMSFGPPYEMSDEWQNSEDIEKDVSSIENGIDKLIEKLGIENAVKVNLASDLAPSPVSPPLETAPSTDFLETYLHPFPEAAAQDPALFENANANAFLDAVPAPIVSSPLTTILELPDQFKTGKGTRGRKRKSDRVASPTGRPKRQKER